MPTTRRPQDEAAGTCGRVVVGVHGSESSRRALQYAVGVAHDRVWDLEIVTAWPDADEVMIRDVPGRYIAARGRAWESQGEALAALDPVLADRVSTFLMNARPAQALIARCAGASLLVVGAGRPGRERDRQGVGAECVKAAGCPVIVVPAREPVTNAAPDPLRWPRRQRHGRSRSTPRGAAASA